MTSKLGSDIFVFGELFDDANLLIKRCHVLPQVYVYHRHQRARNHLATEMWGMINAPMPAANVWHNFRTSRSSVGTKHMSDPDTILALCQKEDGELYS